MIKELFRESSDERVELLSNQIASRGFYLLISVLAITNVIKSFVLELDKAYWIDTQFILLGVLIVVGFMEWRADLAVPKAERERGKKMRRLSFFLGILYYNLTHSTPKLSDGIIGILAIVITTFLYAIVAYGIYKLITIIKNTKRWKSF